MTPCLSRRRLLAGLAVLPAAAAAQPRGLSERDRADIARAEVWLQRLGSLKARFLQIAGNGASAEGTGWIVRPGYMRFEYDPPEPLLMVASHGQFFYFDKALKQPTVVPVSSTPLGILLADQVRLSGDVTVSSVTRAPGLFRISVYRTARPAEGELTLVFAEDPFELRQWVVKDAQGRETRVTLSAPEYGGRYPTRLFNFNDPTFREELGIQ
jgi:outer membrane lipoprotein-sorting protein